MLLLKILHVNQQSVISMALFRFSTIPLLKQEGTLYHVHWRLIKSIDLVEQLFK